MKKSFWQVFCEDICKNKIVLITAAITAVLCFGFTITNFSLSVDDPIREHYLFSNESGSLIQQGRLLHIFLNYLTGLVEFIPFFNDFVGALLFFLSALLFATLFQYVTDCSLSTLSVSVFGCIYISYSIINEKFIYNLDVIVTMLSYCATALALIYAYRFIEERKYYCLFNAIALMIIAAGSYESFIFLYFCGVFAIFILNLLYTKNSSKFKDFFAKGLKFAAILLIAVLLYYTLVLIVQVATEQYGIWERDNPWKNENGFLNNFVVITKTILSDLLRFEYLPLFEFVAATVAGAIFFIYRSFAKKNILLFIFFAAMFLGNFFIHYVCGYVMYRAAQTFCFFVGFTVMVLFDYLQGFKRLKKALVVFAIYLVLIQSADMNKWFFNDYQRYQKESFAINTIATQLIADCDISKPIVFINQPANGYLNNNDAPHNAVNGNSIIYWGVSAFGTGKMHDVFKAYGYDFLVKPDSHDMEVAREAAKEMSAWPSEGSIKEFDTVIVVKMAE